MDDAQRHRTGAPERPGAAAPGLRPRRYLLAGTRRRRALARGLTVYVDAGWVTPAEAAMLAVPARRREARAWARRTGGPAAREAMRDFQRFGTELALLRERAGRGAPGRDAAAREPALLAELSRRRAAFVPAWSQD